MHRHEPASRGVAVGGEQVPFATAAFGAQAGGVGARRVALQQRRQQGAGDAALADRFQSIFPRP